MKTLPFFHSQRAAALPAAAVSAAILSIVVAGVLTYMGNEYNLNFRSHRWTQALHLAEAGVEIGFAEYHYQYFIGESGFTSGRGWVNEGGGTYTKSVSNLLDNAGAVVGSVNVTVTGVGTGSPKILGVGTCGTTPRGPTISRAVRVTLTPSASFPTAMAAKNQIEMNGNNIYVDSFDSTDPAKSTSKLYDLGKRQPNGNVATNSELADSLDIGNADVYGVVATGPGGDVAIGSNGSIGPTFVGGDRADTEAEGEASGWVRDDFQVDIPDVVLPSELASASSLGDITDATTINAGDWRVGEIDLSGSGEILVIDGNVRLYITGDTSISGQGQITINPGSSLQIYAAGSMSISGNAVVNDSDQAVNNRFYGLPSSTSWDISGNGQWVGTIYAPNANLTLNGGGTDGHMSGSIIANSVTLNGKVSFHYDESLTEENDNTGYLVASWQALKMVSGSWEAE